MINKFIEHKLEVQLARSRDYADVLRLSKNEFGEMVDEYVTAYSLPVLFFNQTGPGTSVVITTSDTSSTRNKDSVNILCLSRDLKKGLEPNDRIRYKSDVFLVQSVRDVGYLGSVVDISLQEVDYGTRDRLVEHQFGEEHREFQA